MPGMADHKVIEKIRVVTHGQKMIRLKVTKIFYAYISNFKKLPCFCGDKNSTLKMGNFDLILVEDLHFVDADRSASAYFFCICSKSIAGKTSFNVGDRGFNTNGSEAS